jgi:hypothetical protein
MVPTQPSLRDVQAQRMQGRSGNLGGEGIVASSRFGASGGEAEHHRPEV